MPTKTKKVSASPSPIKKSPAKKSVAKKPVRTKAKVTSRKTGPAANVTMKMEEQTVPVVTVVEKQVHTSHGPIEVHHKYVFIGSCRNCEHLPIGVNKLVAVLSLTIAILSGLLISASLPATFELPNISMGSITDWMTTQSPVKNL